ncbi:hypothetical protein V6Z11_A08G201100 [Gossypium hirsutum]
MSITVEFKPGKRSTMTFPSPLEKGLGKGLYNSRWLGCFECCLPMF